MNSNSAVDTSNLLINDDDNNNVNSTTSHHTFSSYTTLQLQQFERIQFIILLCFGTIDLILMVLYPIPQICWLLIVFFIGTFILRTSLLIFSEYFYKWYVQYNGQRVQNNERIMEQAKNIHLNYCIATAFDIYALVVYTIFIIVISVRLSTYPTNGIGYFPIPFVVILFAFIWCTAVIGKRFYNCYQKQKSNASGLLELED
jgi:hypothetical protein